MIGYCKKVKGIVLGEADCYYCKNGNQGGKVDRYICLEFTEDIPSQAWYELHKDEKIK